MFSKEIPLLPRSYRLSLTQSPEGQVSDFYVIPTSIFMYILFNEKNEQEEEI